MSEPEVPLTLGLFGRELWPRELFIPCDRAIRATVHFLETGELDPKLDWIGLNDFARRPAPTTSGRTEP